MLSCLPACDSFCDSALIGYDRATVTLNDLPNLDVVRLLVKARHSRRAAKEFLHSLRLPSTSADLDNALNVIRSRPDFLKLDKQAQAYEVAASASASVGFDPMEDLRRRIKTLLETPDDFARRVSAEHGVDAAAVLDALNDQLDPALSLVRAMFTSAGAKRVAFDPRT